MPAVSASADGTWRVEPGGGDVDRHLGVAGVDLDQGGDGEQQQYGHLDEQEPPLNGGRDLDADVADRGHDADPDDTREGGPHPAFREGVVAQEPEAVDAGDLGEVRHDDDVGDDDAPAAHPAGARAEGAGRPGEGGPAVGVARVEFLVGVRDQQHRDEGQHRDDRGLQSDPRHDQPQRGREAVRRGGGRQADGNGGEQSQGTGFEPFSTRA